jgi:glycosyltransferase involved in cell wall biosynthesis
MLAPYRAGGAVIRYHRFPEEPGRRLGGLRNLGLEHAQGEWCVQWDDDEWYHPERIAVQLEACRTRGLDAVLLRSTLMHIDVPEYREHPYRGANRHGTPGTILHRKTSLRYRNIPGLEGEDSNFRNDLRRAHRVGLLPEPHAHLFIRCYHSGNTWDLEHFTNYLRRGPLDRLRYFRARYLARDLFTHPRFRLTAAERATTERFLRESRELGLLAS